MVQILEYIQQSGNGKFHCYKTKKLSLDANDTIAYNYDDNTVVQTTKSVFAEAKYKLYFEKSGEMSNFMNIIQH